MILQTADFGDIEAIETGMKDWYQYMVHPKSPRCKELYAASVVLAGRDKTPSYPFRFDAHQINYAKGAKPMAEKKAITFDVVVEAYVNTRAQISALKKKFEEEEAALKALQKKREDWMANKMDETGQKTAQTDHGTCFFTRTESVTVADWDALLKYAIENEAYELFEHRVSKTAALEIMGPDRDHVPPPGTNYVALRTVNVRKSK